MSKKTIIAVFLSALAVFFVSVPAFAGTATLNWNANTEPDLSGYKIYYGTSQRTGTDPKTCGLCGYTNSVSAGKVTSYTFSNLTDGATYYFSISAYDTSNNESSFSTQVSKVITALADTTVPTAPANLTAAAVSSSQINLSWTASTDNVGVTGYRIYRCQGAGCVPTTQIATSPTNSYSNTGLSPATAYVYRVAAYDAAGNVSSQSTSASATTQAASDITPPTVSITAPVNGATVSGTVTVSANASDNVSVAGVQFKLDNANLGSEDITSSYSVSWNTTSASNGSHNLVAVARDAAGNRATSTAISVTVNNATTDTTPPVRSAGSPSGSLAAGTTQATLSLNVNESATCKYSTIANTAYSSMTNVFSAAAPGVSDFFSQSAIVTNLQNGTSYNYYVRCQDSAGNANTNDFAISFSVASPVDTTPPTISSVMTSSITTNSVNIVWSTNEQATSQVEYGLTSSYGLQTTATANYVTSHSVTLSNLSANTTYNFRVKSRDQAGNYSVFINQTFTTQAGAVIDTTPPSVITNLSISNITQTSLDLNWTASGDDGNTGTASSYDIRYSTTPITETNWSTAIQISGEPTPQVAGTPQSMTIVGLSPNTTYYFAMKISDEVPNTSGLSNVASAKTQSLTLSVSLSANPSSGVAPLNNVDLTAAVSGTASGNINYTFYCNRSDSGTNITTPYSDKKDNISQTTYTNQDICSYSSPGTYTVKVITERGTTYAENRVTITVSEVAVPTPAPPDGGGGGGMVIDTTPPSQPKEFKAIGADKQIILSWQNSKDDDFVRVFVTKKEGSQPSSINDGKVIYEGTSQQFTDTNLDNAKTYYYAIYAYDRKPNYSDPVIISTQPKAGITQISTIAPAPSPAAPSITLTGPFQIEQTSDQIKLLQQVLFQDKVIYPEGIISGYYGPLTIKAVQRFQCKYNLICQGTPETTGYGLAGPQTRAKLAEVFAKVTPTAPSVAQPSPVAISVSPVFSAGLGRGITGADVKRLQQILNSDLDTKIADSGFGSPGNETEYFGALTEKAVQKFQCKYNIICSGSLESTGYGYIGPKTRVKINETFKQQ